MGRSDAAGVDGRIRIGLVAERQRPPSELTGRQSIICDEFRVFGGRICIGATASASGFQHRAMGVSNASADFTVEDIFRKVAGVCLYLPTTAIPLAGAVYWVATPGHVAAPFEWHMILPRIADLFGGLMWYAAGLLVGARKARWIGSRLLPAGIAFVGSCAAALLASDLTEALLIFAVVLAIILPAARGAFVSGGSFEPQPLMAKLLTSLCFGVGVICALAIFVVVFGEFLGAPAENDEHRNSAYYYFIEDGRIVVTHFSGNDLVRVTDLKGNSLPIRLADTRTGLGDLSISLENLNPETMPWEERSVYWGFQEHAGHLIELSSVGSVKWFYVTHRRTIEAFDTVTRRYFGSLGPAGFVRPTATPLPFPKPLYTLLRPATPNSQYVIAASENTAYQIDLSHVTVTPIFAAAPGDPIVNVAAMLDDGDSRTVGGGLMSVPHVFVIVTRGGIHVVEGASERFHLPMTHTFPQAVCLMTKRTAYGGYAFTDQLFRSDYIGWIVETDARGRIVFEAELPPLPSGLSPADWGSYYAPMLFLYPPVAAPLRLWIPSGVREPIAAGVILSIAVWTTWLLLRRIGLSRRAKWFWIFFNALLGFPGVLLLLCLFQRIATVPCPACGKRHLVARERCEHCNAPFAPPAMEGIEVFEG
jgi:hypothetical protein